MTDIRRCDSCSRTAVLNDPVPELGRLKAEHFMAVTNNGLPDLHFCSRDCLREWAER